MGFAKEFGTHDPLAFLVPARFEYARTIAQRARTLLLSRTSEQIEDAGHGIAWAIDEYFRLIKADEIDRLKREGHFQQIKDEEVDRLRSELEQTRNWRRIGKDEEAAFYEASHFFNWVEEFEGDGSWVFNLQHESELDSIVESQIEWTMSCPTAQNTSEIEALKQSIESWNDIAGDEFPHEKPYELFAILSLWLLADAVQWLKRRSGVTATFADGNVEYQESDPSPGEVEINHKIALQYSIKAMDAVCHAERLLEIERLEAVHIRQLKQTHDDYLNREVERQATETRKKSMLGEKLNIARHQRTNEAKAKVIAEWDIDRTKFSSAEKAGNHFADWLGSLGLGYQYEPRTCTGWIRSYAKQIGVRFR